MSKKLIIIGTGEIAAVAAQYFVYDSDYQIEAFAVDQEYLLTDKFCDKPVIDYQRLLELYPPEDYYVFVAINSMFLNRVRTKKYQELKSLGYQFSSYISSKAFVWHNAEIGENCFILEDNTIQPFVKIGNNVTLWSGNHIGHSSIIEDNVFVSSHVVISGLCKIGKNSFMGVNSCTSDTVSIGEDNFVGMGTVVNKSTPPNSMLVGNPGMVHKVSARRFCKVND
jgi:sugar O-acyltransferase (sialic acid O-acetyltransferase NeuD family)